MATRIDITVDELHQLHERIGCRQLEGDDWRLFGALVERLIARVEARQARLKAKARQQGGQESAEAEEASEAGPDTDDEHECEPNTEDTTCSGESAPPGEPATDEAADPGVAPKTGHGRNGADAFVNATVCDHALADGIIGAVCAACAQGPVSTYRDKVIIRVIGQAMFAAERHEFEQGRCKLCGAIVTAPGSELILKGGIGTSYITYDWSACAMLIVMHYFAGAPFKRIEALHRGWGVPMPDANQWRVVDESDDLLAPLYRAVEKHGIQNATRLRFDDTGSMIVDTRRKIQKEIETLTLLGEPTKDVRTGINATGVHIETEEGTVILFFTGRHHAGEMLDRLLAHRRAHTKKIVTVTDAASKNFSLEHANKLEQAVCNAHCYLKFRAVKDQYPVEYAVAAEVYAKVFDNDDKAKAGGLDPHERMLFHREHSKPHMLKLWQMAKAKADGKLVEPNSALWEPVVFVINQWPLLTKFYEVPGVPLDSSLVEQDLIIPVRYLAGSFAYKTQNGADVGDRAMSLIATANANGVEPVAYLTECLRNHEDLAKRPDYYLPWMYCDRLEELERGGGDPQAQSAQGAAPSGPSPPPPRQVHHPLRPGTRRAHPAATSSSTPAPPP